MKKSSISQVREEETAHENQDTMDRGNAQFGSEAMRPQEKEASNSGENPAMGIATESAMHLWSRCHKPTTRLCKYMGMLQSMTCMNKVLHLEDLTFLEGMDNPLCFMCPKSDTLYYDQVMQV